VQQVTQTKVERSTGACQGLDETDQSDRRGANRVAGPWWIRVISEWMEKALEPPTAAQPDRSSEKDTDADRQDRLWVLRAGESG